MSRRKQSSPAQRVQAEPAQPASFEAQLGQALRHMYPDDSYQAYGYNTYHRSDEDRAAKFLNTQRNNADLNRRAHQDQKILDNVSYFVDPNGDIYPDDVPFFAGYGRQAEAPEPYDSIEEWADVHMRSSYRYAMLHDIGIPPGPPLQPPSAPGRREGNRPLHD